MPKAKGSPVTVAGEPTGKWASVLAKTRADGKAIEPFEITDGLVLHPPTPARAKMMGAAQMSVQAAISASMNLIRNGATEEEAQAIQKRLDESDLVYTKALIGEDNFDAVEAFFADRGEWERTAFIDALKKQFLRLPDEVSDGKCPTCGHIEDEEDQVEAGKGSASSTTSNTTGTNSNPTSPDTSTPGPETGATNGRGMNSSATPTLSLA